MGSMFAVTKAFNQPLNDWDVSSVTNMSLMFEFANAIRDQNFSSWDVGNVNHHVYFFLGGRNVIEPNWNP